MWILRKNLILQFLLLFASYTKAQETCGKQQSAHQLVYGGSAVAPGEWPWIVSLFDKKTNEFFCAANLISHQHVLTAAHCIYEKRALGSRNTRDIYANIGRLDITPNVFEPQSIKSDIKHIILHPSWNPLDIRFDADIAILVLQNPIPYSNVIQPVCLPNPKFAPFRNTGFVVGYGGSEAGTITVAIPRKVQISSTTNENCFFNDFNFARFGSPRTFCAGQRGKTPCRGDSGSGFFVSEGGIQQIAGIVSSAVIQECGQFDYVLFTNVAKFTNWIYGEIQKTQNLNSFDDVFNSFDNEPLDVRSNVVNAQCNFKDAGTTYGCFVDDLVTPDQEIVLNINRGAHKAGRTSRDVSVMNMKGGQVTYFPDLSRVMQTFPSLNGFGITFTKLKHIERSELKGLEPMKFFLISDNEIEYIPPDTFLDLKNLELIDICRNKVKNIEPNWLAAMPKLRVFKARNNKFNYVPAAMFRNNPVLEEIYLDTNEIRRVDTNFMEMKNLKAVAILSNPCINMKYCKSQEDKECIRHIRQFAYFVFAYCGVFDK